MDRPTRNESDPISILGRHLVAVGIYYRLVSDKEGQVLRFAIFAGASIDVRGIPFIITAGHNIEQINEFYLNPEYAVESCVLIDTFGVGMKDNHPIPFDYKPSLSNYIDDADIGLDFGVIQLNGNAARLLSANGIVPLDENAWKMGDDVKAEHHFVLGFPEKYTTTELRRGENPTVSPTLVRIRHTGVEHSEEMKPYPRFVAVLEDVPLLTLRGMSGGPIFAFDSNKLDRYWIVSLQSSWNPATRKVYGTCLSAIGSLLYGWADAAIAELQGAEKGSNF